MKILLTGDFHVKKGIFTEIILNYLDHIFHYCLDNKIKEVFILGDVFDKSSNIKNEAFVPLFMKFYEMKMEGLHLTFILGNHDIYTAQNDSIVETFSPIGTVIKEPCLTLDPETYLGDDWDDYVFLPYTKKESDIPQEGRYLFTHVPIADFSFDNAYHATEKYAFKKALFENYQLVFTGHFHRHQHQKNIVYVGSPVQLSFAEEGTDKGFVVFDEELENWEFIKYEGAPEFIRINIRDFNSIDVKNKFVSVKIDTKIENYVKLKRILFERGALDVVPVFESNNEANEEIKDISETSSIKDMVREYLTGFEKDGIDKEKLLKIYENVVGLV